MKTVLENIGDALAGIQSLTVADCERAFNCVLRPDDDKPAQYWGTCPDLRIDVLDVRIGQTGGIVVANLDERVQEGLAKEVFSLGELADIDIVSPPISPVETPSWSRKWAAGYTIAGAKIWFGMEEIQGRERLISVARRFK